MAVWDRFKHIGQELKAHSPFTLFGAALGIAFMLLFKDISKENALRLFAVFHPLHVVLSAMVTAALFKLHRKASSFLVILVIGYVGSVGIATLSDCIVPYLGESVLGVAVPTHAALHTLGEEGDGHVDDEVQEEHTHKHPLHLGFIEEWYLVNPAALVGVILAYVWPRTKIPHAMHVLVSTWASASYLLMSSPEEFGLSMLLGMFVVLFAAVWLPCCVSDIVFPTLFLRADGAHLGHHSCVLCGKHDPAEAAEGA
jgi:hypothetical protein